jgi:hypothetical protein
MVFKLVPIQKIYKSEFCERDGCACMDENHFCLSIVCPYRISVSGTAEEMRQYRAAHCRIKESKVEPDADTIPERKPYKMNRHVISRSMKGVETEYDSVKKAAEAVGLSPSTLYPVIVKGVFIKGCTWRYKDA